MLQMIQARAAVKSRETVPALEVRSARAVRERGAGKAGRGHRAEVARSSHGSPPTQLALDRLLAAARVNRAAPDW